MKNFVIVNYKKWGKEKVQIIDEHNEKRKNFDKEISYLLPKDKVLGENISLKFNNFEELEKKRIQYLNSKGKKDFQRVHLLEFVVALSHDQLINCLKNNENVDEGFLKYKELIEKEFKVDAISLNIHKDEGYINESGEVKYNYHAHLICHNFSFERGGVVASIFQRKDLSKMQNLANEAFSKLGFTRGQSSHLTKRKHLERDDFIKQEKQRELKSLFVDIDKAKKELKNIYTDLNTQKNEAKKQRNLFEKNTIEYKEFNEKFLELQKLEKEKREEYRNLENNISAKKREVENNEKYEQILKKDIEKIILDETIKEKPTFGKEFFKVEDRNRLFTKLVNKIKEPLNIEIFENERTKKENLEQKKQLEKQAKLIETQNLQIEKQTKLIQNQNLQIEKQTKKIQKLQNRTSKLISFFKQKALKMGDLRKYFKKNKLEKEINFFEK